MLFTYEDQVAYVRLALALFDSEKTNPESLEKILYFGELINQYSGENNTLIYDTIEYIYEQLRLLRGEAGAYDDKALYERLKQLI